jgi:mannitol/fructose-specific phosphotransferase system IIA component (Ntr-type)
MIVEGAVDAHVDREHLFRSVRDREALCSTALVPNAAFPHPLDPRPFRFSRKRVLLAVLREPVAWSDPHGHRPRVIVMILARSMQGHLLALSRAIKLFGDATLTSRLAAAPDAAAAIAVVGEAESLLVPPAREVQR